MDRGSPKNLLLVIPAVLVFGLIERYFHRRFGSLVLANPNWPRQFSVADKKLMEQYNIQCNDEYFAFGEMHFDTLQQAVEYARAQIQKPTA